jgi:hypothetical protein
MKPRAPLFFHPRVYLTSVSLALVSLVLAGCGGSEGAPLPPAPGTEPGASGGGGGGAAMGAGAGDGGAICAFTRVEGETRTAWSGAPRARMNGSGNLNVRCTSGDEELELAFGNGTFDGPRTYGADDFSSDGDVSYDDGGSSGRYTSTARGASCVLVLAEAPLDAHGSSVPKGGVVAGSFTCSAVVRFGDGATVAIEGGELRAIVE